MELYGNPDVGLTMAIKIIHPAISLFALATLGAVVYTIPKDEPMTMELLTSSFYTCVNTERDMTCFGGEFPMEWDGVSIPDASIVLHRVGQKARVVSDFAICTDRGECFGDPMVGASASEVVLQPLDYSQFEDVKAARNFACGLTHIGEVDCWGEEWGTFREDLG